MYRCLFLLFSPNSFKSWKVNWGEVLTPDFCTELVYLNFEPCTVPCPWMKYRSLALSLQLPHLHLVVMTQCGPSTPSGFVHPGWGPCTCCPPFQSHFPSSLFFLGAASSCSSPLSLNVLTVSEGPSLTILFKTHLPPSPFFSEFHLLHEN